MTRLFKAVAALIVFAATLLPARAAVELQNFNTNQFIISPRAAPNNVIRLNLAGGAPDMPGSILYVLTNYIATASIQTNYTLAGGTNILVNQAIAGTNVDITVHWVPVVGSLWVTNLWVSNFYATNLVITSNLFNVYTNAALTNLWVTNFYAGRISTSPTARLLSPVRSSTTAPTPT